MEHIYATTISFCIHGFIFITSTYNVEAYPLMGGHFLISERPSPATDIAHSNRARGTWKQGKW